MSARMPAGVCARCGNTRAGAAYEFWYGTVKAESHGAETTTSYTIGGQDSAFICDQCIADRRRRLRRVAVILPTVNFVVLVGVGTASLVFTDDMTGFLMLGLLGLLFGPALAPVLLWQINRNPDFSRERTGWLYATRARAKDLRGQGYTTFWTEEGLAAIAAEAQPAGSAPPTDRGGSYSFVRDQNGSVVGMWLRDATQARNQELLLALLLKHGEEPTLMLGGVRIVPNTYDGSGGSFVMFGGASAPGER